MERYPAFASNGATYLHDPLAAAVAVRPDLVRLRPLRVDVETEGQHAAGMTLAREPGEGAAANAGVALSVAVAEAEAFVLDRIAAVRP